MIKIAPLAALGVILAFAPAALAATPEQAAFLARCQAEGGVDCPVLWRFGQNALPMADALMTLAAASGPPPPPSEMRARLDQVRWRTMSQGELGDVQVVLPGAGQIALRWRSVGSEGKYDVITALQVRGAKLQSLGCPRFPGASMGTEKVLIVQAPGRRPFVMSVYLRPAPTGFAPGVYEVDAEFGRPPPSAAALRAGRYPGGGGRDFAAPPTGWDADC